MSALLPCPFCGGDVECTSLGTYPGHYRMTCAGCSATLGRTTHEAAIATWNRRAPGSGYTAGAEVMREAVERLVEETHDPGEADDTEAGHRYAAGYRDASNAARDELNRLLAAIRALPLPEEPAE